MKLLQRLFGKAPANNKSQPQPVAPSVPAPPTPSAKDVTRNYYDTMSKMQKAMSRQDYAAAAQAVRENLKFMAGWVKATREEYGRFDISSIPTLEQGGLALALVGDDAGLKEMREIIAQNPDLAPWAERADQSSNDRHLFITILDAVTASPSCLLTDVKTLVNEGDRSRVALLTGYLERAGKLARIKTGKTYKLVLPGAPEFPVPAPKREVASHRQDRNPPRLREIDISKLEYVPLPRSPHKWEEAQAGREQAKVVEATQAFEVRDADWQVASIEKLRTADRPGTAFRLAHPCAAGLFLIDDRGRAEGFGPVAASALCYDRQGRVAVKAALLHDVYRLGVHPTGHGMIALSREAVLHAYNDELKPIIETALSAAPEIVSIRKRFEIQDDELKNHIRCVALSRDATRYLFTVVDEAWCVGRDGVGLWGTKLPVKDGWTRVAAPSAAFSTSAEVERALVIMGLKLPITPEELKRRYRTLAKQWHPDLNPGDPKASEKMVELSAAAEVLTGIDAASLPQYTGAVFAQELHRSTIEAGGLKLTLTMGMQVPEIFASDWVYAASFATNSDAVYLAGYSGRIVLVDENGVAVRVYDIGAVPRQIMDTGSYLYLLTYTRLYVLKENTLHALIDTFDSGDLIIAQNGFGLLEKKRLRWYSADGTYLGSIVTREPIRRVFRADGRLVIETRQLRATILGADEWWTDPV